MIEGMHNVDQLHVIAVLVLAIAVVIGRFAGEPLRIGLKQTLVFSGNVVPTAGLRVAGWRR